MKKIEIHGQIEDYIKPDVEKLVQHINDFMEKYQGVGEAGDFKITEGQSALFEIWSNFFAVNLIKLYKIPKTKTERTALFNFIGLAIGEQLNNVVTYQQEFRGVPKGV